VELVHRVGWLDVSRGPRGLLGLRRRGATFVVDPCIPSSWHQYEIVWQFGSTRYEISVSNPDRRCRGVASAELDGAPVNAAGIPLADDGRNHQVRVVLGNPPAQ
jgi:cyclic beta-1,2-glucan synthetase